MASTPSTTASTLPADSPQLPSPSPSPSPSLNPSSPWCPRRAPPLPPSGFHRPARAGLLPRGARDIARVAAARRAPPPCANLMVVALPHELLDLADHMRQFKIDPNTTSHNLVLKSPFFPMLCRWPLPTPRRRHNLLATEGATGRALALLAPGRAHDGAIASMVAGGSEHEISGQQTCDIYAADKES